MSIAAKVMQKFYRKAEGNPAKLPWHNETPSEVLVAAVKAHGGRGRALDVGCGAGTFSVWMAQQGMDVTGIDLFPEAIEMARAAAADKGVQVELIVGDLFAYAPPRRFDVVFDSGCLHALVGGDVARYKKKVLEWLAPSGDYVLLHWGKRHAFDWRPIGPRRRTEAEIARIFAPKLKIAETEVTDFAAPLPFGPVVRGVGYRMIANNASSVATDTAPPAATSGLR